MRQINTERARENCWKNNKKKEEQQRTTIKIQNAEKLSPWPVTDTDTRDTQLQLQSQLQIQIQSQLQIHLQQTKLQLQRVLHQLWQPVCCSGCEKFSASALRDSRYAARFAVVFT